MTTTNGKASPAKSHPLIGRGFHSQQEDLRTVWQGNVTADCGDGYFLVQFYEWLIGGRSTSHIFHISELAAKHPNGTPRFRFFNDLDEANEYMQSTAGHRDTALDHEEPAYDPD